MFCRALYKTCFIVNPFREDNESSSSLTAQSSIDLKTEPTVEKESKDAVEQKTRRKFIMAKCQYF